MLRELTLGQYYPADSIVHRLDPRTKLFGTMVFIASLFIADNIWGYLIATFVLAAVIRLTQVPVLDLQDHKGRRAAGSLYGSASDLSGDRFVSDDPDDHSQSADRWSGKGTGLFKGP